MQYVPDAVAHRHSKGRVSPLAGVSFGTLPDRSTDGMRRSRPAAPATAQVLATLIGVARRARPRGGGGRGVHHGSVQRSAVSCRLPTPAPPEA
jgi:hypothetical protein